MTQPILSLLLVRHGEAQGNRADAFLGHADPPLSTRGQAQAVALAEALRSEPLVAVYTSPLARARATAREIAFCHGLAPSIDERLCEQSFGLWEGLTFAEVKQRYPADYVAWQIDAGVATPTEGESLAQVTARHLSLCYDLRSRHSGETVALVGHGGGLGALLCGLLQTPLRARWPYRLALGSVSQVMIYPEGAVLTRLNHA